MASAPVIVTQLAIAAATTAIAYLLTPDPPDQEGPQLDDTSTTTSAYGKLRTIQYGINSNRGNIIDSSDLKPIRHEDEVGGKGGKSQTVITYTYKYDVAVALGEGPIEGISKIFVNERLMFDTNGSVVKPSWLKFKVYYGTEDQLPDPTLQALHGVENTPAYRGEAYIVFTDFLLEEFGNRPATFRIITHSKASNTAQISAIPWQTDFSGNDAAFVSVRPHPTLNTLFHGLTWYINYATTNRDNPICTVVDIFSNTIIYQLNKPDTIDVTQSADVIFGTVPQIEYGAQVNGDYENVGIVALEVGGLNDFILLAYENSTDSLVLNASLENSKNANLSFLASAGSLLKNRFLLFGLYKYTFNSSALRFWDVISSGIISYTENAGDFDPASIGLNTWRHENIQFLTNHEGDLLIRGIDSSTNKSVILKYKYGEGLQWYFNTPAAFYDSTQFPLYNGTYDSIKDYWWFGNGAKILGIDNTDGSQVGIWDLSANPNYYGDGLLSFNSVNENLIWIDEGPFVTAHLWDTNDNTLASYRIANTLPTLSQVDASLFHLQTNSIFYSVYSSFGANDSRKMRINLLENGQVSVGDIVSDLCNRAGLLPAQYNTSEIDPIIASGYMITNLTTVRSLIAPLAHAYLFELVDSNGILKFVRRGGDSVATIEEDDLGASSNIDSKVSKKKTTRLMEKQLYSEADIIYIDANNNYENGHQHDRRKASNNNNKLELKIPVVLDNDYARQLISTILHLIHIEREIYEFSLMPKWQRLEGGDIIDVEVDGETLSCKIVRTELVDNVFKIEAVRNDKSVYTNSILGGNAPIDGREVYLPGTMVYALLDMPLLRTQDNNYGFYSAATAYTPGWVGGVIYKSFDDDSWSQSAIFTDSSIYGTVQNVISEPANKWTWDTTSVLTVKLISGELDSYTKTQALQGFGLAVYGKHGRFEVISYVNATEIDTNLYEIDTILRGRLGTDHNCNNHAFGDLFIPLITTNLQYVDNEATDWNQIRYYRGVSMGVNLFDIENKTDIFTNTGVSIKPYAPVHIKSKRQSGYDELISWMPRSRYPSANFWSSDASEVDNLFDIEFYETGEIIPFKTVTDNISSSYTWLRSDQLTEVGGAPKNINISVYHKSSRIGRGYEGIGQVQIGNTGAVPYHEAVDNILSTIVHFRFDEGYSDGAAADGLSCIDEKGTVTDGDATYEYFSGTLSFVSSISPNNINDDPTDKAFYTSLGTNSYVDIPSTGNNVFLVGNKFAISMVLKCDSSGSSFSHCTRENMFNLVVLTNGRMTMQVYGPEGVQNVTSSVGIDFTDGVARHLVVNVNIVDISTNTIEIYVNGTKESAGVNGTYISAVTQDTSAYMRINSDITVTEDWAFHNDVLSEEEIDYLYFQTGL